MDTAFSSVTVYSLPGALGTVSDRLPRTYLLCQVWQLGIGSQRVLAHLTTVLVSLVFWFLVFVNVTLTRITWQGEPSVEKWPPSDWLVCKSVQH